MATGAIIIIVAVIIILVIASFFVVPFLLALWERRNQRVGDRHMGADQPSGEDPPRGDPVPNREQTEREKGEIFDPH